MTKKLFTLLVLIVASISSFSQNVKEQELLDSEVYYMISDTRIAKDSAEAKFVRLYNRIDSVCYNVEEFYMNKKPKLVAKTSVYSVDFRKGLQGYCMEYYNNGKRKSIKNYEKGQLVGEAIEYYPNGVVYNITDNDKNGIYLKSFSDSTGKVLTENGNGVWQKIKFDRGDRVVLEGNIVNGKEDGIWKKHISDTTFTIIYKKGEIISGKEYINMNDPFAHITKAPEFPGGEEKFFKFLAFTIKFPSADREQKNSGRVILTFAIDKDGTVTDEKIVKGVSKTIDAEVIRAIKRSPKWKPGTKDGRPDKSLVSIPVSFDTNTGSSIMLGNLNN